MSITTNPYVIASYDDTIEIQRSDRPWVVGEMIEAHVVTETRTEIPLAVADWPQPGDERYTVYLGVAVLPRGRTVEEILAEGRVWED
jgi:hypothetical protein